MKMEYVHEFVVLANVGYHFEAAEQLFISQSSLSKHMRSLEKDLGVKLFERDFSTKRSYLNENGKIFLDYASQMDEAYQNCSNFFSVNKENSENSFSIGLNHNLYYLINDFQASFPEYKIRLIENQSSQELHKMMQKGTCDVAILTTESFKPDFQYLRCKQTQLEFLIPKNHPLAQKKSLSLHDIQQQAFIIPNILSEESRQFYRYCQKDNFSPKIHISGVNAFIMLEFVRRGLGISIAFNESYTEENLNGIAVIPYNKAEDLGTYLVYSKRIPPLPCISKLIQFAKEKYGWSEV